MQMETISKHAVKYRTEKYFKNKLIKNFTCFDLGKKGEFKCSSQRASNVKLYFNFPFSYHKEEHVTWKKCHKSHASKFAGGAIGFIEVRGLTVN